MDAQHIVSAYDRDLEDLQGLIMKMGGLVEAAIMEATTALVGRDTQRAEKIRASDRAIDALEEQINEDAARIIALRAPKGADLRTILTVMKIAGGLERIGDYAKNMAKRTAVLAQNAPLDGSSQTLRAMAQAVQGMLKDALDSFVQRNVDLATDVRGRDADVDQAYNALFRQLLTHMMEDPRNITVSMHLHFIAKNIERMGDHVTNIAEQVIYLTTGELPEEARPKQDVTAMLDTAGDSGQT